MAQYQCQCTGGYTLANIPSAEVNNFITALAGGVNVWIGLNDQTTEGTYLWSDGSALGNYTSWKDNYPTNPDIPSANKETQDCIRMMSGDNAGLWHGTNCAKPGIRFVCEASVPSSTTIPTSTCTTPTTEGVTTVITTTIQ